MKLNKVMSQNQTKPLGQKEQKKTRNYDELENILYTNTQTAQLNKNKTQSTSDCQK